MAVLAALRPQTLQGLPLLEKEARLPIYHLPLSLRHLRILQLIGQIPQLQVETLTRCRISLSSFWIRDRSALICDCASSVL